MPIAQFSGLASGIDSGALIDAIIEARELRNQIRRDEIEFLESENESLEELNTKLLDLDDLISKFRTANGNGVAKKSSSTDPAVATASVGSNAYNATYSLDVSSIADGATGSFNNSYASETAVVSAGSGDVTLTIGTGGDQVTVSATVTAGVTNLTQLANALNADPDAAGRVVASVVNVGTSGSPDYRLLVTTLESGLDMGTLAMSADAGLTELQTTTIDQASDAVFTISGITGSITRSSNTVEDVISGVTFNLTDTGSTDIAISNDPDKTADEISQIVEAFNDIVSFVAENDTIERVEDDSDATNVFGSLAKTRLDNDFLAAFRTNLLSASSSGTSITSMSQLGLSTNRDGTITFDADDFKEAVDEDPEGVTGVLNNFADSVSGVSGTIFQYTRFSGFIDVAQESNNDQIENLSDAIANLERQTDKQRRTLELRFANLEKITGDLQSQQQALSGILAGLG
ncbi:MAG: flagellar filament capping protein FliD [Bdellovibrionales bacterium]|nr:flagellar filament capping protein FliD [Bdellovibrionales bacterium]